MKTNDVFVERTLPKKGELVAEVGEKVEPFTKLGMARVSYGRMPLGKKFKVARGKDVGTYFYTGDVLGKQGRKKIVATFDGLLMQQKDGTFIFQQEEREFWLLAGVWGEVVSVSDAMSALVKTQMIDLHLAVSTDNSFSGELVVFPNPSPLLEMHYLQQFSKDPFGKIIYIGDHISVGLAEKAIKQGLGGLIGGSVDREALKLAKAHNLFLGGIVGFGNIPTPEYIFNILKDVSNRYVFLQGDRGLARIPAPEKFTGAEMRQNSYTGQLRALKKGLLVQVFEEPYFGWVGTVEKFKGSTVFVKVDEVAEPVEVQIPNILSLE